MDDPLGRKLIIVFILLLINAFFAAAEIAVISLNGNKLRYEAENGNAKARKLLRLVEQPTQFLSTIQIAITLAGFLASAFAADTFSDPLVDWLINDCGWSISRSMLSTISVVVITIVLSYFTLVLGELVPKRLAMAKPEKVTQLTSGVVLIAGTIFRPVVWLLTISTNGLLHLFGVDPNQQEEQVSEEEIRLMVDIGEEKGAIEATEKEMIDNIFEFNNITAEDVMVHRTDMVVVWIDDSTEDIVERIRQTGRSRYPVCGEDIDDILGLLLARDFLLNAQSSTPKTLHELITPTLFVPETIIADRLFRQMQQKQQHLAVVVDEYGGTAGLVTMEDLLEEIVGNIYDESDKPEDSDIIRLEENLWQVAGSCEIEEFCEALDITIPEEMEEEFETVGGLIFSALSEIPADGSQPVVNIWGLEIQVEKVADRRIEWALVRKPQANQ